MLSFPFEAGQNIFAAKIIVEYFNTDQIEIATDRSWLVKDDYIYPSYLSKDAGFKQPEIVSSVEKLNIQGKDKTSYIFSLPDNYLSRLNNLILKLNYTDDKGLLYLNHRLIADDLNNGTTWSTGLNRLETGLENQEFRLEITPLPAGARIYFDDESAKQSAVEAKLKSILLVPEYRFDFNLNGNDLINSKP